MRKLLLILLFTSIILIAGCNQDNSTITYLECSKDVDCGVGGCSSQVCGLKETTKDMITTCEYKQEYDCLKQTSCRCIENRCKWEENNNYDECLAKL